MITSLLFLGVAIIFSFGISTVAAANSSSIYVSTQGNDSWDGQSANHTTGITGPKLTITNATGTVTLGGTIYIANGTYNEHNITIKTDMNIVGESQTGTIIDAQGKGTIFTITSGTHVTIQNLTLANGNATQNLTIEDGNIIVGGAICNSGNLAVINSAFTGNTATGNNETGPPSAAGAIFNYKGTLTLIGSTFTNNSAVNGLGGAIFNFGGSIDVTGSTFTGNTAIIAGAIGNWGNLTCNNSIFIGNNATMSGGAIGNMGNLTFTNSTFIDNSAVNGGAIDNEGTLNVIGSNFTSNNAIINDAFYAEFGDESGNISIINSMIDGGAIYND